MYGKLQHKYENSKKNPCGNAFNRCRNACELAHLHGRTSPCVELLIYMAREAIGLLGICLEDEGNVKSATSNNHNDRRVGSSELNQVAAL